MVLFNKRLKKIRGGTLKTSEFYGESGIVHVRYRQLDKHVPVKSTVEKLDRRFSHRAMSQLHKKYRV